MKGTVCVLGLAMLLFGLMVSPAEAVNFTVDSTGDQPDDAVGVNGCHTAVNTCTLRAAIQESNASGAVDDTIGFASSFDGEMANDTITLGSELAITDTVGINGGDCGTSNDPKPCVGVHQGAAAIGFHLIDADNSQISGLAVTGATFGIHLGNASSGFIATNDWFGVKLDGATAGANGVGMLVDVDSNGAQIGGTTAASRDVFVNNTTTGLDIEGADNNTVQGSYFGVRPDGTSAPTANTPTQIEITGSTAGTAPDATGNLVGGTPFASETATQACDGPCNVIANATDGSSGGINLNGDGVAQSEKPAGQTSIRGNYVGFDAPGTGEPGNFNAGIVIGGADQVTVGGSAAGDGNRFTGASSGIVGNGDAMTIQNNVIGLNFAQTAMSVDPPSTFGILASPPSGQVATINGNRIARPSGVGLGSIDLQNNSTGVATITGNEIGRGINGETLPGGPIGIKTQFAMAGHVISDNVIQNAGANGIQILGSDMNTVTANQIVGSGSAGIRIATGSSMNTSIANTIGGISTTDENAISNSGGDAIEIAETGNNNNVILRNTGSGNAGEFIDLGADGPGNLPGGPNLGIQAPVISTATATSASGTAEPNADVLLFRKATAANGEIESFIVGVESDGAGNWTASYASLPAGTSIGAIQINSTTPKGSSEMAVAQTPGGGGGGGGGGKPSNEFTLGKVTKNKSNGTAKLAVTVPGPGTLTLTGNGLKAQGPVAVASRAITAAGSVTLKVKAKGAKRARLEDTGTAKVKPKVTYTPTGADPNTKSIKIKLIDRT